MYCSHIYSCGTFEDHSLICFDYINNDAYKFNESNQITKALANVTDIVDGSYCKERVMEFLCNYFFPQCKNDTNIVPICQSSCNEYLMTGICADHLLNVLTTLNTSDYHNIPVDELSPNDCHPPYNVTVSDDDCIVLTSGYTYMCVCLSVCVYDVCLCLCVCSLLGKEMNMNPYQLVSHQEVINFRHAI